jgi:hypothetical protein
MKLQLEGSKFKPLWISDGWTSRARQQDSLATTMAMRHLHTLHSIPQLKVQS